ncbi:hypothetical protein HanXRQr2_Chr16g0757931 [Helianthus annuus]|uniref:Uncharacterized protein n=1 Tax=Helianthus annuus TaxID=4232 RepID=A0A9K3H104_HELAN|nr:hypothetical protein HanXRQr2_Chr16g0757931 [Helianthus annuus]
MALKNSGDAGVIQACWGLGYVVATLFFAVVEMSIDTIMRVGVSGIARMQRNTKGLHIMHLHF